MTVSDGQQFKLISIHALHEESDRQHEQDDAGERISIHALHEESDGCFRVR